MYFWRIEQLKAEMAERPLSSRQELPYVIILVGLSVAAGYVPLLLENGWDRLGAAWSVAAVVLGTLHVYRRNGGAAGRCFLQRYLAVGWVVSVRWMATMLSVIFGMLLVIALVGREAEETTWFDFALIAGMEVMLYWRIGLHVGDLARRADGGNPDQHPPTLTNASGFRW